MRRIAGAIVVLSLAGCAMAPATLGKQNNALDISFSGGSTASSADPGPLYGRVLGPAGQPELGVAVTAYLVNSSPLANASALTNGSALTNASAYRTQGLSAVTGSDGTFVLTPPSTGSWNLEAATGSLGAFDAEVAFSGANDIDAGTMTLQPTGTIAGRVVSNQGVSNFTGTQVYVPGTSYQAHTDASGSYEISGVPVGTFEVDAVTAYQATGRITGVTVDSATTAQAADLAVSSTPPAITAIEAAASASVSAVTPGEPIYILGSAFGASTGAPVSVDFSGATPVAVKPLSDGEISVTVPADATTGNVEVLVDGVASNPVSLQVFDHLVACATTLTVPQGRPYPLGGLLEFENSLSQFSPVSSQNAVNWQVSAGTATVDATGDVTVSTGTAVVTASVGPLQVTFDLSSTTGEPLPALFCGPTGPEVATADVALSIVAGQPGIIGGYADGAGASALFNTPAGIVSDGQGHLYVADVFNHAIREITLSGNGAQVSTFAGAVGQGGWVAGNSGDPLQQYDAPSLGTGTTAHFGAPISLALDGSGNLYVMDRYWQIGNGTEPGRICELSPTGAESEVAFVASSSISTAVTSMEGLGIDPSSGNLYVADAGTEQIWRATPQGVVSAFAGTYGVSADALNLSPLSAIFDAPTGVAVDGSGDVVVSDSANNKIKEILSSGQVVDFAGSGTKGFLDGPAPQAEFNTPEGLAFDAEGDLLVADSANSAIRMITPAGLVLTLGQLSLSGQQAGSLLIGDVATDNHGNYFVTAPMENVVLQIHVTTP